MSQEYDDLIYHLDTLRQEDIVCLVEGKKDKAALLAFGIDRVVAMNSRPYHVIVDELVNKYSKYRIALLTDLDSKGKEIFSIFYDILQEHGVKFYHPIRDFLESKTNLHQIEGLPNYAEGIKNGNHKSNGKIRTKVRSPYYPNSFY